MTVFIINKGRSASSVEYTRPTEPLEQNLRENDYRELAEITDEDRVVNGKDKCVSKSSPNLKAVI